MKIVLPCLVLLLAIPAFVAAPARAQTPDDTTTCERAAAVAEQAHGLPSGILAAIGRIESGRRGPDGVHPWPWTLDAEGNGAVFPTRDAAIAAVATLQRGGMRSIDVGCFQINLSQHPNAFPTLDTAFDPAANADYAARFLTLLQQRTGSWADAVMHYHSASPERGIPYRDRVLASWTGTAPPPGPLTFSPPTFTRPAFTPPPAVTIPGLHIWTPSAPGTAPMLISLTTSSALPRVTHRTAGQ